MAGCVFENNSAQYDGGGISIRNAARLVVDVCNFTDNKARSGGGAAFQRISNEALVLTTTFDRNEANAAGGAIFNAEGSVSLSDCDLKENKALKYGGGMYTMAASPSDRILLHECMIVDNRARLGGYCDIVKVFAKYTSCLRRSLFPD